MLQNSFFVAPPVLRMNPDANYDATSAFYQSVLALNGSLEVGKIVLLSNVKFDLLACI